MTGSGHFVYFGSDPESVLQLIHGTAGARDATVTVSPSAAVAVAQTQKPRTDCLIVDETLPDTDLEAFLTRLTETVPGANVVVRTSAEAEPNFDFGDLAIETMQLDASAADRWNHLADHVGSAPDVNTLTESADGDDDAGTFTETLHRNEPNIEESAGDDSLTDRFTNTPTFVDTFLNNVLDIFFVFDFDLQFRLWNDSFNDVTGFSDEEIASLPVLEFIAEDDRKRAMRRMTKIIETGQATAEFTLRTKDGSEIPYSFTGSLISGGDYGPYICGIGRDISARKERELELRRERDLTNRIIETSPVGIIVIDADGTILRANSRATKIFDMTESELEEYLSDGTFDLYDEGGGRIPRDDHPIVRTLETGDPVYGSKHLVELADGERRWVSKNAAPITDSSGAVSKVVVAVEDITELKRHEQELAQRKAELDDVVAELKRSNAELERFAYVASHDLKEPLRMISNYLGLLERRYDDELDDDAQDFIDYATDGAERMQELINGLLQYSRTQRNDVPLEPVDSEQVVETVRSNLGIAIEETGTEVTTDPLPTVHGDRSQLVQLFQNLVSNAITYSGEAPPRITISVERTDEMYRFAVSDEGVGISDADTGQVFDIFYSGTESDSTGIGLAICKKIVENHGGRIWVESEPGVETTFYFTLPAECPDQSAVGRSVSPTGS